METAVGETHKQIIEYPAAWLPEIDAARVETMRSRKSMVATLVREALDARARKRK